MPRYFIIYTLFVIGMAAAGYWWWIPLLWAQIVLVPIFLLGIYDRRQRHHSVTRNFPVIGHLRFMAEFVAPELHQYFVESSEEGTPFNRELRSIVYQRAKNVLDTHPFGTQKNVYGDGYEWMNHSLAPVEVDPKSLRLTVGGEQCKQPYNASIMNISAMSFGALSKNAILALNGGAKDGGFAHNTGEGGLSPYHLKPGGDITWQIGTGYFGCRNQDGTFNFDLFKERATLPQVKMIEIKLSQGAKPGHGGILPKQKLTKEIAKIRLVEMGHDVISPPAHSAFSTPTGLLDYVVQLREGSGGKPVGFKICIGNPHEFLAICKAIVKTGIFPDFITVDGGEGGTGAAPLEFSNHLGLPGVEALIFVHNSLTGFGLRNKIRVIHSGKVITSFQVAQRIAMGADLINCARGMMMALGCIQSIRCNSNKCPVGVATQDPKLVRGLSVPNKRARVAMFHEQTVKDVAQLVGAMGVSHTCQLKPRDVMRRTSQHEVQTYNQIYDYLKPGSLLEGPIPMPYSHFMKLSSADSFLRVEN